MECTLNVTIHSSSQHQTLIYVNYILPASPPQSSSAPHQAPSRSGSIWSGLHRKARIHLRTLRSPDACTPLPRARALHLTVHKNPDSLFHFLSPRSECFRWIDPCRPHTAKESGTGLPGSPVLAYHRYSLRQAGDIGKLHLFQPEEWSGCLTARSCRQ